MSNWMTTGLRQASLGFNRATTGIVQECIRRESNDDGAEDAHSHVNSRVYKGGKVSS